LKVTDLRSVVTFVLKMFTTAGAVRETASAYEGTPAPVSRVGATSLEPAGAGQRWGFTHRVRRTVAAPAAKAPSGRIQAGFFDMAQK
jgi:hypothetical protein